MLQVLVQCGALQTRSYLKIRIFGRDQGGAEYQPAGILKDVEDLKRSLNADIGRKGFLEMAYRLTVSNSQISPQSYS